MIEFSYLRSTAQNKWTAYAVLLFCGGERGIRTLVRFWRKLISSQPRYDHFDTSPCKKYSVFGENNRISSQPRYVPLRCPKFVIRYAHQILTAATPFCSLHLPPAALANVPTSISLRMLLTCCTRSQGELSLLDAYCTYLTLVL